MTGIEHRGDGVLVVDAESPPSPVGCPGCGVVAESAGRKALVLTDAPMGGRPVAGPVAQTSLAVSPGRVRGALIHGAEPGRRRGELDRPGCDIGGGTMRRENAPVRGIARQLRVA